MAQLPDLRDSVRREHVPAACVLLRGGPDSVTKLRRHAERMARMFRLDGDHVLGISMFAAIDDVLASLGPPQVNDQYGEDKHWRSTDDRR